MKVKSNLAEALLIPPIKTGKGNGSDCVFCGKPGTSHIDFGGVNKSTVCASCGKDWAAGKMHNENQYIQHGNVSHGTQGWPGGGHYK